MSEPDAPLLSIRDLVVEFRTARGCVRAVDGLGLELERARTLCLVGESGCGKTVTGRSILRLVPSPAGRITAGSISFNNVELLGLEEKQMRELRGDRISMIYQEPLSALNPVFQVGEQVAEGIRRHRKVSRQEAYRRAVEMLEHVGIPSAARRAHDYPGQLSGGMRQRVLIAMALSCRPDLLIADEPTTALDVTIQAQILELMKDLQREMGMAILFITHDLAVVAHTADKVAVMYAGRVVELVPVRALYRQPAHPYTIGLLNSIPAVGARSGERRPLQAIPGTVPDLARLPRGCRYQDRCPLVFERCRQEEPPLIPLAREDGATRSSACWRCEELLARTRRDAPAAAI